MMSMMRFLEYHPLTFLLLAIVLTTALVVGVVAVPSYYVEEHTCATKAAMLETEYQFGFWEGCWIKQPDNTWVEYSKVRNVGGK